MAALRKVSSVTLLSLLLSIILVPGIESESGLEIITIDLNSTYGDEVVEDFANFSQDLNFTSNDVTREEEKKLIETRMPSFQYLATSARGGHQGGRGSRNRLGDVPPEGSPEDESSHPKLAVFVLKANAWLLIVGGIGVSVLTLYLVCLCKPGCTLYESRKLKRQLRIKRKAAETEQRFKNLGNILRLIDTIEEKYGVTVEDPKNNKSVTKKSKPSFLCRFKQTSNGSSYTPVHTSQVTLTSTGAVTPSPSETIVQVNSSVNPLNAQQVTNTMTTATSEESEQFSIHTGQRGRRGNYCSSTWKKITRPLSPFIERKKRRKTGTRNLFKNRGRSSMGVKIDQCHYIGATSETKENESSNGCLELGAAGDPHRVPRELAMALRNPPRSAVGQHYHKRRSGSHHNFSIQMHPLNNCTHY